MFKQIRTKYKTLKPSIQLIIAFVVNCIWWLLGKLLTNKLAGETDSIAGYVFYVLWMGCFFAFLLNWGLIKEIFRKKTHKGYHQP